MSNLSVPIQNETLLSLEVQILRKDGTALDPTTQTVLESDVINSLFRR